MKMSYFFSTVGKCSTYTMVHGKEACRKQNVIAICLRADLILTNAGQDRVLGTSKILRGNINNEKVYAMSVYRKMRSRKWEN